MGWESVIKVMLMVAMKGDDDGGAVMKSHEARFTHDTVPVMVIQKLTYFLFLFMSQLTVS